MAACCSAPTPAARSTRSAATAAKKLVDAARRDRRRLARADQRRRDVGRRDAGQQAVADRRRGGKATPGPALEGRRDRLVARGGRQHRVRGHRPVAASSTRSRAAPRKRGLRHRRQAHHRADRDERRRGVVRHLGARARVPLRSEGRQDARDGRLRRQRNLRDRAVPRRRRRRGERSRRDAAPRPARPPAQVEAAEKPTAAKGQATKAPDVGSKPGADKDPSPVTDLGRKGAKKGKGALFRVGNDGRLDQLHALTATYFTSVAVGPDGAVYAGAADKGRIYMVDADESVGTAFDVDERSVSQVWVDHGLVVVRDRRRRGDVSRDRPRLAGALRLRRARCEGRVAVRQADVGGGRQGQARDAHRQHRQARRRLERVAVAGRDRQASAAATRAARSRSPPGRYLQFRVALEDDTARAAPRDDATTCRRTRRPPCRMSPSSIATKEKLPTLKDSAAKPR